MKRVLVTGGAGFIGCNFIRHVFRENLGWQVLNLDKLTYAGSLDNTRDFQHRPGYRFVRGDIADRELVDRLFRRESFDAVVNFAAESHVDRSILDPSPFIDTNVRGVQVLLEAARRHAVSRFVQVSTDEVYGSVGSSSCAEDASLRPNSPYAASKGAADLLCHAYVQTYGLPVIITRSSNNYGPYQFPEKLVPIVILRVLGGEPIPVYGMGRNIRDWLYVEDHCRALVRILRRGRPGSTYNIAGGEPRRNIEVVRRICEHVSRRLRKPVREFTRHISFVRDRPGHDFRYSLDGRKIKRELGWVPGVPFEEGLRRTVDWYLEHREWSRRAMSGAYREYRARVYERGWR